MRSGSLYPILAALLLVVAIAGYFYFSAPGAPASQSQSVQLPNDAPTPALLPDSYATPGQRTYYKNDQYGYGFEIPAGFTVAEYGVGTDQPQVLIQNSDQTQLMLLQLQPAPSGIETFTADQIHAVNPTFDIVSPITPVTVGQVASGVTFDSQGTTWNGGHRYWFVHAGTLYRFSGPNALKPLVDAIVSTWRFTK